MLAEAFQGAEGFSLESGPVETNLVWVSVDPALGTAAEVAAYLRSRGIMVAVLGSQVIRACTHLDVTQRRRRVRRERDPPGGTRDGHGRHAGVLRAPRILTRECHRRIRVDRSSPGPRLAASRVCRTLLDQLSDSLLRACLYPLVWRHGDLPHLLHQYRADGVFPGRLGGLPRRRAKMVAHDRVHPAGPGGRRRGARSALGLSPFQQRDDRRGQPAIAATDLLRHRRQAQGPLAVRGADRGAGRGLLRADRACSSSGRGKSWAGASAR